jgi:hypothetical protein
MPRSLLSARLYDGGATILIVLALSALLLVRLGSPPPAISSDGHVRITAWDGQGPQVDAAGQFTWVSVPGMVVRQRGGVLRVTLAGPFPKGAWTQHGGAIATLAAEIPVGTPFTVRFQARTLSGATHLSVLRRWGSSRPYEHVTLTPEWTAYEVRRTASHPTQFLTFSLAPRATGLHTLAVGAFEIKEMSVQIGPEKGGESGATM